MTTLTQGHSAEEIRHGLPIEYDLPIATRPDIPDMRDGINIWFFEENGEFGVPRLAIDAVGDSWDAAGIGCNIVFPDGRVLEGDKSVPAISPLDDEGKPTIRGSTALRFRCIEPFRKWHMSYDDEIVDTTIDDQIACEIDRTKTARIRIEIDIEYRIPVWAQIFADDDDSLIAGWMGRGWRYETPVLVSGTFEIDGKQRAFRGTGNLIRRKSRRSTYLDFPGHVWHSAIFPDGRAFGLNVYPPKDGVLYYNTGFIYKDGTYHDAKVVEVQWLGELAKDGDDCSIVLESALGRTHITGVSLLSTYKPSNRNGSMGGLNLHQGGVRFTWDDQTAIGVVERSSFVPAPSDASAAWTRSVSD